MPYEAIDSKVRIYGEEYKSKEAIAVLTDRNSNIQSIYCAEVGKENKAKCFYSLMDSFFESLKTEK